MTDYSWSHFQIGQTTLRYAHAKRHVTGFLLVDIQLAIGREVADTAPRCFHVKMHGKTRTLVDIGGFRAIVEESESPNRVPLLSWINWYLNETWESYT